MVLDETTKKKILDLVSSKPRTIDEISKVIDKNWRTADRYVDRISKEEGIISTRVFREGTRGALKIVFYPAPGNVHAGAVQDRLFDLIKIGRKKFDFNPLDIYQYIDNSKRSAFMEELDGSTQTSQNIVRLLKRAEDQVLILSGNLSWINLVDQNTKVIDVLKDLVDKGVSIKILTRIDIATMENLRLISQISNPKNEISVRHREHPLRGFIIDDKIARLKEVQVPESYKKGELKRETTIYYDIYDSEWVEWLQKVFWNLYSSAIDADKRITALESVSRLL